MCRITRHAPWSCSAPSPSASWCPDTFNMFQRQLFSEIERRLEGYGYRSRFFLVKADPGGASSAAFAASRPRCWTASSCSTRWPRRNSTTTWARESPPVVPVHLRSARLRLRLGPHRRGSRPRWAATGHLISLGHERIGLICGLQFSFGQQRRAGYLAALERAGIAAKRDARRSSCPPIRPRTARPAWRSSSPATWASRRSSPRPTSSPSARSGPLYEVGVRVPADLSIIGFDDIDISVALAPSLSTVRQPIKEMGAKAADLLYGRINGRGGWRGPMRPPLRPRAEGDHAASLDASLGARPCPAFGSSPRPPA